MISSQDIKVYRIPRWNELPDLDLYMDQVISVLEKNLSVFSNDDKASFITPTMINNYVKQKLVSPPTNKKYGRGHIVSFYIISLMKQIMPISEINAVITLVVGSLGEENGYNFFCNIFESTLKEIFVGEKTEFEVPDNNEVYEIISSISLAYANMLYARTLLSKYTEEDESKKEKKEKKK